MEAIEIIRRSYEIDPIKIRVARAEKDWSKTELANESGVTRHTIAKIEKNQVKSVQIDTLEKIATALGKTIQDFQKSE